TKEEDMASDGLCWMPASEMAAAIRRKKISPVEVMKAVLARIERLNPTLNAFVTLTAEQAMRDARAAERALGKRGATLGPLHGVPFSTKDLVNTRNIRTTFGTRLYADNVPTETAPIVERMLAAGAIQLGKTNTPPFGGVGATPNPLFGVTRNPWNPDRTPGGSSGGGPAGGGGGGGGGGAGSAGHRHGWGRVDPDSRLLHGHRGPQGLLWPHSRPTGECRVEPLARGAHDADGDGRRPHDERVRGARLAGLPVAARRACGLRQGTQGRDQGPPRRLGPRSRLREARGSRGGRGVRPRSQA